ncbi:hypothetical protein AAF712_003365 [Marasmius tenuissimus]|uniref:Uncharacterized protein n=1 Tax=Marasmius tenuissimus TaxID=585030 RepID=A0ABR3A7Q5_9AGAR
MFLTKSNFITALSAALLLAGQAIAQEPLSDPVTACKGLEHLDKCHYWYMDGDVILEFNGYCVKPENEPLKCDYIRDPPNWPPPPETTQ